MSGNTDLVVFVYYNASGQVRAAVCRKEFSVRIPGDFVVRVKGFLRDQGI